MWEVSWGYKTHKEVDNVNWSDKFAILCTFLFDQRLNMRLWVSLAFICMMLPAGKSSKDEQSTQKLMQKLSLCLSAFINILHSPLSAVYGIKCFTCWGATPGTCNEIWNCAKHFDRCSTTIGKLNLLPHVALIVCILYGVVVIFPDMIFTVASVTFSAAMASLMSSIVWTVSHILMELFLFFSVAVAENMVTKECMRSDVCNSVYSNGVRCCAEDLCNGAKHTGFFVPLLLAPIAIITLFIWSLTSSFLQSHAVKIWICCGALSVQNWRKHTFEVVVIFEMEPFFLLRRICFLMVTCIV